MRPDIVERLRGWWDDSTEGMNGREARADDLMHEAALEIERLRELVRHLSTERPGGG